MLVTYTKPQGEAAYWGECFRNGKEIFGEIICMALVLLLTSGPKERQKVSCVTLNTKIIQIV